MSNKRKIFLAVLILSILACGTILVCLNQLRKPSIDPEEYSVFSVLMNSLYPDSRIKLLVFNEKTNADLIHGVTEFIEKELPELEQATLNDFINKNKHSYLLSQNLNLRVDYSLISEGTRENIFQKENAWGEFYNRYPGSQGITTLSRVGFNSIKTQALVYEGTQSDYLAGRGFYILLAKENGAWKIKKTVLAWVS
jgi:hypothetical protein